MSPSDGQSPFVLSTRTWRWCVFAVVGVAILFRLLYLGTWSLWEDEEGTIYYALNPHKAFPRFFPIFFLSLRALFSILGQTVEAARVFSVVVGLLSLGVVYLVVRRLFSREAALLAVFLLALNLGHVFWSQSIRYYTAVLAFEGLSLYWFFRGFEEDRPRLLLLSCAAFLLALFTHFSAVLLIPVFIGYLGLALLNQNLVPRYRLGLYLTFGVTLALEVGAFAERIYRLQRLLGGGPGVASARDPFHVLITVVAYFGLPIMVLAVMAPFVHRWRLQRASVLMMVTAVVPVLELPVITSLNVINVAWYYGFISIVGFAALAGDGLVTLARRGAWRWAAGLLAVSTVYSLAFLGIYFITGHGDRPRWKDAARFMLETRRLTVGAETVDVFATAPNVLAFYLGVPPDKTQGQSLVQIPENKTLPTVLTRDRWYVVPAFELLEPLKGSIESRCTLEAEFDARTGPRDRTLRVYVCPSDSTRSWHPPEVEGS